MKTLFTTEEEATYEEAFKRLGYKILTWETFGSWQGDYAAILEKDGKLGFVVIGYGSCSGCDSLQAVGWFFYSYLEENYNKVLELDKDLRRLLHEIEKEIVWGTPSELVRKILVGNKWSSGGIHWYKGDEGYLESRKALVTAVLGWQSE